jgi:hypothetical protein
MSAADRYAVLQRKLEDLERVHAEGKKSVSTIAVDIILSGINPPSIAPNGG